MTEFDGYATGTPCWVDVSSPDLDASIAFYSALFGWEAERAQEPEAGGYTTFRKEGKRVAAGGPLPQEGMTPSWTTYLATDDADATAERVRAAGGTVLAGPFDVLDEVPVPGVETPFYVLKVEGRGVAGVREPVGGEEASPHWSTVFAVADADETVARAAEHGGSVAVPVTDLPGIGRVAVLKDPVGASFQVMAPAADDAA